MFVLSAALGLSWHSPLTEGHPTCTHSFPAVDHYVLLLTLASQVVGTEGTIVIAAVQLRSLGTLCHRLLEVGTS